MFLFCACKALTLVRVLCCKLTHFSPSENVFFLDCFFLSSVFSDISVCVLEGMICNIEILAMLAVFTMYSCGAKLQW